MTVASTTAKAGPYDGDDSTVGFTFAFKVQSATDIKVVKTVTTAGVQIDTTLTVTTHYTVALNTDQDSSPGGEITMVTAPATGDQITILRSVTATQGASLPNQGGFYPKVIENALDKQAMLIQQAYEILDRCLQVSVADSTTDLQDLLTSLLDAVAAAASSQSSASASASTATTQAGIATTKAGLTALDALATAADRVQTGLDVIATAADRVQTGLDIISSASSASTATTQAGIATTKAGLTALDAIATAADRVQTGLDRVATAADVVLTHADVVSAAASAASAAAIANAFIGTSTTSWTPAVESKAFTTQAGELYTAGIYVTVVSAAAPTAYGWGQVTNYSGTALTVDVQLAGGSGSHTDWNISLAGVRGATGATGPAATTIVGLTGTIAQFNTAVTDADLAILGANNFTAGQNFSRATVASHATTADIWAALGNQIDWTGTATTTIFPNAPQAGAQRELICAGACAFTAGANMIIDGIASGSTITCAAGDTVTVTAVSTTQFKLHRNPLDGKPGHAGFTVTLTGNVTMSGAYNVGLTFPGAYTYTYPGATDTLAGIAATQTLTNKRVTPRVLSAASYTTDTGTSLNCDTLDEFIVTAQAGALKFNNPTGTPTDGQVLLIAVTGTAARALTYDTQFQASTVALPSTTVTTARLNMAFIWSAATSKWIILGAA